MWAVWSNTMNSPQFFEKWFSSASVSPMANLMETKLCRTHFMHVGRGLNIFFFGYFMNVFLQTLSGFGVMLSCCSPVTDHTLHSQNSHVLHSHKCSQNNSTHLLASLSVAWIRKYRKFWFLKLQHEFGIQLSADADTSFAKIKKNCTQTQNFVRKWKIAVFE